MIQISLIFKQKSIKNIEINIMKKVILKLTFHTKIMKKCFIFFFIYLLFIKFFF